MAQPLRGVCGDKGVSQLDPPNLPPSPKSRAPAALPPGGEKAREKQNQFLRDWRGGGFISPLVPPRSGPSLAWSSSGLVAKTQVG